MCLSAGYSTVSLRAASCTMGRASGTRVNRCRGGRWDFTGAKTASRYGVMRHSLRMRRRPAGSRRPTRKLSFLLWPSGYV